MVRITMHGRMKRQLSAFMILAMLFAVMVIPTQHVLASGNNYYVGGANASDGNPGTASAPFATIQKAAYVAVAGDTVNIRTGTYRETITPANSGTAGKPIVFQPDGNAQVTVSGADEVKGSWSVYKDKIYQTDLSLPVTGYNDHATDNDTLMANQVFVDGKMMIEARWPNVSNSDDLLNRADFRSGSYGKWEGTRPMTLDDPGIPQIPEGWVGGRIWINGWFASTTFPILSQEGTKISFTKNVGADYRKYYYLTGRLGALDVEKEWHYDGTKLYLRAPGSGVPKNVEVKMRNYAFDLNEKSYITIKDIDIFAATVITSSNSSGILIDGISAKYISHHVDLANKVASWPEIGAENGNFFETGILLMGPDNVIKNSRIAYSSGNGIVLGGAGAVAHNNLLHDISYGGRYECAIFPAPNLENNTVGVPQTITYNTVYRTGRSAVHGVFMNKDIGYNDFSQFGLLNTDLGAIYTCAIQIPGQPGIDLTGTRIHHNWLHDTGADERQASGVYFDQGSGAGALVDHNVIWNTVENDAYSEFKTRSQAKWYNNTFGSSISEVDYSWLTYSTKGAALDDFKNNIYSATFKGAEWEGKIDGIYAPGDNSLNYKQDAKFVNKAGGDFRLQSGSPAIDKGVVIAGITDGYVGSAPDLGAYEYGGEAWVPGYSAARGSNPARAWTTSVQATPTPASTPTPTPAATPVTAPDLQGASSWAVPEISEAVKLKLTTDRVMKNYTSDLTREEFCELAVKLYEAVSGKTAAPVSPNPFTDTTNTELLKAYELGITNGVSASLFGPSRSITRQEICVMIGRTLKAAIPEKDFKVTLTEKFTDESDIADWALESVRLCFQEEIMKGTGLGNISPKANTTKEQGILLIKRAYENYQ